MDRSQAIELSVVLPAYNEGAAVTAAVERYVADLPAFCEHFEIIVVNDGSTDDTLKHALGTMGRHSCVQVLDNEKNLGQMASLLRGFAAARGQVITHNGVDLPFDPRDTEAMLKQTRRGADVVVAERLNRRAYGLIRKVISWGNIFLVQALFRSPVYDHNFV